MEYLRFVLWHLLLKYFLDIHTYGNIPNANSIYVANYTSEYDYLLLKSLVPRLKLVTSKEFVLIPFLLEHHNVLVFPEEFPSRVVRDFKSFPQLSYKDTMIVPVATLGIANTILCACSLKHLLRLLNSRKKNVALWFTRPLPIESNPKEIRNFIVALRTFMQRKIQ
jgi:hypothetical protein